MIDGGFWEKQKIRKGTPKFCIEVGQKKSLTGRPGFF